MATIQTEHPYVVQINDVCGGRPIIKGTRIPVWLIAGWFKDGYSPEQIQKEIYPHLSLAQIYDALSYYHDHVFEIDAQITAQTLSEEELEQRRAQWQSRKST